MKKLLFFLVSIVITSMLVSYSGCEDECDKTEMPTISKEFSLFVQVKYQDGVLFDGKIDFEIFKMYCNGKQTGYFSGSGSLNQSGYFIWGTPTYNFSNEDDYVQFKFTAYHTPFYPAVEQTEIVGGKFNYAQAETASNEYDEINKTYYITIPTNSDGTK